MPQHSLSRGLSGSFPPSSLAAKTLPKACNASSLLLRGFTAKQVSFRYIT